MFKVTLASGTEVLVVLDTSNAEQELKSFFHGLEAEYVRLESPENPPRVPAGLEVFRYQASPTERQRLLIAALYSKLMKREKELGEAAPWLAAWAKTRKGNGELSRLAVRLDKLLGGETPSPLTSPIDNLSHEELFQAASALQSLLGIQVVLNSRGWDAEMLDGVAEQLLAAGLGLVNRAEIDCSPEELEELYNHDQHPVHSRLVWREAVAQDSTLLGYWEWVHHAINEED